MSRRSATPATSQRLARMTRELARARQSLETLYAALNNVDSGLLLLNRKLRAVYSNPSLHAMFRSLSPEYIREKNPPYVDLLKEASAALAVDVEDYVARRLAWVKSGDPAPMDLKMANGTVLRCHLTVLPGGGRMLIYSDITDIVRNAEELERLATTDGMTGIYNRRHFLTLADREWRRARRHRRPISFLMVDIDYFKSVNDTFGHQIGDRLIVHLANVARERKRDSDLLARMGGEEFALLLPETDLAQAHVMAERLRREVASSPLLDAPQPIPTTVSIGVAAANDGMPDLSDLMRAADEALYDAKRAGRNRVCGISAEIAPSISPDQLACETAARRAGKARIHRKPHGPEPTGIASSPVGGSRCRA
jgi:diguanylate cyclase (GGDEF)-like protein